MNSKEDRSLFDYVLVVGLINESGSSKAIVKYRFPPEQEKDSLADTIVQFCFPEAEQWINSSKLKEQYNKLPSQTFNFVLTEQDATKKFGYCRRLVIKDPKGELIPECYCILSFLPSGSLFYELLNIVEKIRKERSSSAVFSFLKSVLAKSFPKPGETISIKTFEGDNFDIKRADDTFLLDFVSFEILFKLLNIEQILTIMSGLLTESRIIVCANSVSVLSSCVNAITALIYPFTWQHVYIPILPKSLMGYCCAPMPFIVGVLKSNLSELNTYPLEEVILIDLDNGKFMKDLPSTSDYKKILPDFQNLKKNFESIKTNQNKKSMDLAISQICLDFLFHIFSGYEHFIQNAKFDREKFKKSKSNEIKKFLNYFDETQIYECFIREREEMAKNNTLNLCPLSEVRFSETVQKTNLILEHEQPEQPLEQSQQNKIFCKKCKKELSNDNPSIEYKGKYYCSTCFEIKKSKNLKKQLKSKGTFNISIPNFKKIENRPKNPKSESYPNLKPEVNVELKEKKENNNTVNSESESKEKNFFARASQKLNMKEQLKEQFHNMKSFFLNDKEKIKENEKSKEDIKQLKDNNEKKKEEIKQLKDNNEKKEIQNFYKKGKSGSLKKNEIKNNQDETKNIPLKGHMKPKPLSRRSLSYSDLRKKKSHSEIHSSNKNIHSGDENIKNEKFSISFIFPPKTKNSTNRLVSNNNHDSNRVKSSSLPVKEKFENKSSNSSKNVSKIAKFCSRCGSSLMNGKCISCGNF